MFSTSRNERDEKKENFFSVFFPSKNDLEPNFLSTFFSFRCNSWRAQKKPSAPNEIKSFGRVFEENMRMITIISGTSWEKLFFYSLSGEWLR